ncbi:MAG: L,D-transpeptidase family protein [Xanthomonadaceae bacterium]|nr:L,D-transpeptidase family protein [Xanthomonadaceae bacterium]
MRWAWLGWLLILAASLQAQPPPDPVAGQIRERIELWRSRAPAATGTLSEAEAQFYEQHAFAPAWGRADTVQQLLRALQGMTGDGLDPQDYGLSQLAQRQAALATPAATPSQRAQFDLLATEAYLSALMDLQRGKVDPATLDPHWNFDAHQLDPVQGVQAARAAVDEGRVAESFERARPQHPIYARLRTALAQLRAVAAQGGWLSIPAGAALKPGMDDPRVPLLRQRLQLGGYLPVTTQPPGERYDTALAEAVRRFQQAQYLPADGVLGEATRAALNVPVSARIDQLRVNLERARWLLHHLQGDFVVVDIAGYQVTYYRDGAPAWHSRVQVGKPYRSTPVFKSQITYLTLNPTWTVPPTILRHDILPRLRKGLGYLAANRLRVLDSQGRPVAPSSVDWNHPRGIVLRQDAGSGNALGRLAIRFPNDYSVYMHDTPHKELFARERRAFSSGCIRVERPRELAVLLLDDPQQWNRAALDRAIDTDQTRTVSLRRPVPLLLAYWTVHLDDDGTLGFRPDIYRRDAAVLAALDRHRPMAARDLIEP